jgi:hypothetical protein
MTGLSHDCSYKGVRRKQGSNLLAHHLLQS